MHCGSFAIPDSHPSLEGHFPGRPLVPGVVLLDEVSAVLCRSMPGRGRITGFARVKFAAPVPPGREVEVRIDRAAPDEVSFICAFTDGAIALRGVASFAAPA